MQVGEAAMRIRVAHHFRCQIRMSRPALASRISLFADCMKGVSRSATVAAAWLIWSHRWSADQGQQRFRR